MGEVVERIGGKLKGRRYYEKKTTLTQQAQPEFTRAEAIRKTTSKKPRADQTNNVRPAER